MSANDCTAPVGYRQIPFLPGFRFGEDGTAQKLSVGGRGTKTPIGQWGKWIASRRPTGFWWIYVGPRSTTKPRRLDELICEAFHGERPIGCECLAKDGNRDNLRADNLEWGSLPENVMDPSIEYREWGYVPGYKGGADGSIWSSWGTGNDAPSDVWKRMEPTPLNSGHLQVSIKTVDGMRRYGVHHLLSIFFYGPCPDGHECCHNDGIPWNNVVTNLRWGTRKSNAGDQIKHGTMCRGESKSGSKLKEDQVVALRAEYASDGVSISELARRSGVSHNSMSKTLTGETWKHLPGSTPVRRDDAKIDEDRVRRIRSQYAGGSTQFQLAIEYGVSPGAIHQIVTCKTWAHVQ